MFQVANAHRVTVAIASQFVIVMYAVAVNAVRATALSAEPIVTVQLAIVPLAIAKFVIAKMVEAAAIAHLVIVVVLRLQQPRPRTARLVAQAASVRCR